MLCMSGVARGRTTSCMPGWAACRLVGAAKGHVQLLRLRGVLGLGPWAVVVSMAVEKAWEVGCRVQGAAGWDCGMGVHPIEKGSKCPSADKQ